MLDFATRDFIRNTSLSMGRFKRLVIFVIPKKSNQNKFTSYFICWLRIFTDGNGIIGQPKKRTIELIPWFLCDTTFTAAQGCPIPPITIIGVTRDDVL